MSDAADLGGSGPAPFIVSLDAPSGFPWEQRRAAELAARHNSPLPLEDVILDVQRLGRWRLGEPARFAAAFFRRDAIDGEAHHLARIDMFDIRFLARDDATSMARQRDRMLPAAVGGITILVFGACLWLALTSRAALDTQLDARIAELELQVRHAEAAKRRLADKRDLGQEGLAGSQMSDMLEDLVWLARARDPGSAVRSLEWTPQALTLSTETPGAPIATRDRAISAVDGAGGMARWAIPNPREPER